MRILFVKRAYNPRLHNQAVALAERGHEVLALLDAPPSSGYNGPDQWTAAQVGTGVRMYLTTGQPGVAWDWQQQQQQQQPSSVRPGVLRRVVRRLARPLRARWGQQRRAGTPPSLQQALCGLLAARDVDVIVSSNDALPGEDGRTAQVLRALQARKARRAQVPSAQRPGARAQSPQMPGAQMPGRRVSSVQTHSAQRPGAQVPRARIPVVYECQDILTDCFGGNADIAAEERAANEQADGVIYTNPVALAWAAGRYRLERALSFPNYGSPRYFQPRLPKLSAADGRLHLVYCGSVQQTPPGYEYPFARDMKAMFGQIAALGHPLHLHLGLYPGTELARYYSELADVPNIVIHPYQPFAAALRQLTQYDIGLFPVELGSLRPAVAASGEAALRAFPLSRADTLKQYEYVLAGLPVLTAPLTWLARWVAENGFGAAFHSVEHLGQLLRGEPVRRWQQAVDAGAGGFAIERQTGALEQFLEEIVERVR